MTPSDVGTADGGEVMELVLELVESLLGDAVQIVGHEHSFVAVVDHSTVAPPWRPTGLPLLARGNETVGRRDETWRKRTSTALR